MSKKQISREKLEEIFSYEESRPEMNQPIYTFKEADKLVTSYFTELIEHTSDSQYDSEIHRVYTLLGAEAIGFQIDETLIDDPEVLDKFIFQISGYQGISKTLKILALSKFYEELGLTSALEDDLFITDFVEF